MAPKISQEDVDDDPIIASYSVFIKPPLPPSRKLLVLQQPNRHAASVPDGHALPFTELRLKPRAGIVEADMRIETADQYDRAKGVAWGAALQKSTAARNGGSHGLPGGFSSVRPARGRPVAAGQSEGEDGMEEHLGWDEALRQDKVLRTRTLGGQAPELTDCQVMVGVFQGDTLHLTPATNHIHLRTQLHHLDAATEQERLHRQSGAAAAAAAASAGTATTAAQQDVASLSKPAGSSARAIHMTIKSAAGADGDSTLVLETMADRLRGVQREPWVRMRYVDENTDDAWDMYAESLLVRPPPSDENTGEGDGGGGVDATAAADKGKGKGRDVADGTAATARVELKDKVPHLQAQWEDDELLRAVSGIKHRAVEAQKTLGQPVTGDDGKEEKSKGKEVPIKVEDQAAKKARPGRASRGGAAASSSRGPQLREGEGAQEELLRQPQWNWTDMGHGRRNGISVATAFATRKGGRGGHTSSMLREDWHHAEGASGLGTVHQLIDLIPYVF